MSSTNEILAELLKDKEGEKDKKNPAAAILALLLANQAMSMLNGGSEGWDVDFAIPVRPPVA